MLALLGLADLDTNVNLPNTGQAPDLPLGAVVEANAAFRRDSLKPIVAGPLPPALRSLVGRVAAVQQLVLQAGLSRDKDLAFAALLNDPLVTISTDQGRLMFDELVQSWGGWR
jgi:alpha-galactosidase/6-phospho-beta-glucosidase family protein